MITRMPALSREKLAEVVAEHLTLLGEALPPTLADIRLNRPGLSDWGGLVAGIINQAMGSHPEILTNQARVFQNAYIFGSMLVKRAFEAESVELPEVEARAAEERLAEYGYDGTVGKFFTVLNHRRDEVYTEDPDYIEAVVGWAVGTMNYGKPTEVASYAAIGGSEAYTLVKEARKKQK